MKKTLAILLILISTIAKAQDHPLSVFDNLVGKTWVIEGKWTDGSVFKQETSFEYGLNKTIVKEKTFGFINEKRTEYGERNHGIQQFDQESGSIKFYVFDVFGGKTEGTVRIDKKDIGYYYAYQDSQLVDYWEYKDDQTYTLKIAGVKENGDMDKIYMEADVRQKQ